MPFLNTFSIAYVCQGSSHFFLLKILFDCSSLLDCVHSFRRRSFSLQFLFFFPHKSPFIKMPSSFTITAVIIAMAGASSASPRYLAPEQDIKFWNGENAANPLRWLGANGPWSAGDNVFGIDPEVPDNCFIDQAAYISRHGSRYPDTGAYNGWVEMQQRVSQTQTIETREICGLSCKKCLIGS